MAFHRCAICLDDGSVVASDLQVALEEADRDGVPQQWYGTITLTHEVALSAGEKYRLMLDDGRTGKFLVRRNTSAGETSRAVAIHGMGPLR
jgi:hypothetical protein